MTGSGYLGLKVAHHPFWRAAVDGQPARVVRISPAFMAVALEAGRHRVQFRFRNPWWQKGLLGLSLLAWAMVAGVNLRRRWSRPWY